MQGQIRVSVGTAASIDLIRCRIDSLPTTAYLMMYTPGRCSANCGFCAQAQSSHTSADKLSRVSWPAFPLPDVLPRLSQNQFQRLCIQTLCYPGLKEDLIQLLTLLNETTSPLPISIALPPLSPIFIKHLKNLNVERVAISLDATTPQLFDAIKGSRVKGSFSWQKHLRAIKEVLSIFGPHRTTTHLMIGLGETEAEVVSLIQQLIDWGITIGLFPFTPLPGTLLAKRPRPSLAAYRRIQLALYLIRNKIVKAKQMGFHKENNQLVSLGISDKRLKQIIYSGLPFLTTGCPGCNRPFFTERPGGPLYNYPLQPPVEAIREIHQQLGGIH